MDIMSIISNLGFSVGVTQDVALILLLVAASLITGLLIGRFSLITILVNIYVSLALLAAAPKNYISGYNSELIFFFACLLILTLLRKSFFEISISGSGRGYFGRVLIMSFLEIMLLLSAVLSILPKTKALGYVSPNAYQYLVSPVFHFIWLVLPLIFIFIIHKKLNR